MGHSLGALEEIILLLILREKESYGAELVKLYTNQMKKQITLPAVVMVLKRLEKKGLLNSEFGEATAMRGGKRKRFYRVTPYGKKALDEVMETRRKLWDAVPPVAFEFKVS